MDKNGPEFIIDKVSNQFDTVTNIANVPGKELLKVLYNRLLINNDYQQVWGDLAGHLTTEKMNIEGKFKDVRTQFINRL